MKTVVKTAAIAAVLGVLLIVAVPVHAGSAGNPPSLMKHSGGKGDRITVQLDRLEAAGYEVGAIRAAVESGDMETARTLLQEFMKEHKDIFPPPAGKGGKGDRITVQLDRLEAAGYEVGAIRAAVESGDMETARTLLQEFTKEHKDAFPDPPAGGLPGSEGMRERPTEHT